MPKFVFRLQKVLEHRERQEEEAKRALLEGRAERIAAESDLVAMGARRQELMANDGGLDYRLALDALHARIDDEELQQKTIIDVLTQDEARLLEQWQVQRQEAEALRKLREKALAEWAAEENRKEQAGLDEWATQRRTA